MKVSIEELDEGWLTRKAAPRKSWELGLGGQDGVGRLKASGLRVQTSLNVPQFHLQNLSTARARAFVLFTLYFLDLELIFLECMSESRTLD